MKLSVAAAAIAFSGTALFFAPTAASAAPVQSKAQTSAKAGWDGAGKAGMTDGGFAKAGVTGKGAEAGAKVATMDYDGMGGAFEEASLSTKGEGDTSAKFASADMGGKAALSGMDAGGKMQTASMDMGGKSWSGNSDSSGKLAMNGKGAGSDQFAGKQATGDAADQAIETAAVAKDTSASGTSGQGKESYTGMGGPEEAVSNYPPCQPGPGDDRCIQLYERGVSAKA